MKNYRISNYWLTILILLASVPLLPFGPFGMVRADPVQGAASVIKQVKSVIDQDTGTSDSAFADRFALVHEMELYGQLNKSLNSTDAALQWLALVEHYLQLPPLDPRQIKADNLEDFSSLLKTSSIKSLFEIIPGPDSWPVLAELCRKRLESGTAPDGYRSVLLAMNLLNLNVDQVLDELNSFESITIEQTPSSKEQIQAWFERVKREIRKFDHSARAGDTIEAFSTLLGTFESFMTEPAIVRVPDLLAHTDSANGAMLLERALTIPRIYLVIPFGKETRKLGVSIARENLDALKRPQWGLVNSIETDTITLFEELFSKFERSKIDTDQDYAEMVQAQGSLVPFHDEIPLKQSAISYYVLGLLAQNRLDDALIFTGSLDSDLLAANKFKNSLEATERTDLFVMYSDFLDALLQQKPTLAFWEQYASLALINHEEEKFVSTITRVLTDHPLDFLQKQKLKKYIISVYLAQDRIEDALNVYREIDSADPAGQTSKIRHDFADFRYDLGDDLYTLGTVLKRQDIAGEGIKMALQGFYDLQESSEVNRGFLSSYKLGKIATMHIESKEYHKAEELIVQTIMKHLENPQTGGQFKRDIRQFTLPDMFVELAKLYVKSGNYREVIALLDQSPWWNAADLADLHESKMLLSAAQAFHATSNSEAALKSVQNYILQKSSDDEGYRLLAEMAGNDTIGWLDNLYKTDRFEERPLIWKAQLLYREKKFGEAERVIRQALGVDPTDGEQKAGQRVYSYALLADILEAKGDHKEAGFFRNVVDSVRIAERGDEFSKAGLVTRSIEYYQEAMGVFADAYCIQWRLGERLYATGDLEGAKRHYKIAFERMPEQFGQVASFCFGCEGAFDKMESRSAAEEVFSHLLETTPDRPQVYFLYGLLRKSQKRIPEAYQFFKQAVDLDENYLDAWKEISKLSESVYLTREEKDAIILKMLSLDPQQKHFSTNLSEVVDLAGLWQTLEKNQGTAMSPAKTLYSLRASVKQLQADRAAEDNYNTPEYFYQQLMKDRYRSNQLLPAEVLSQHPMVSMLDYFIRLEKM